MEELNSERKQTNDTDRGGTYSFYAYCRSLFLLLQGNGFCDFRIVCSNNSYTLRITECLPVILQKKAKRTEYSEDKWTYK